LRASRAGSNGTEAARRQSPQKKNTIGNALVFRIVFSLSGLRVPVRVLDNKAMQW